MALVTMVIIDLFLAALKLAMILMIMVMMIIMIMITMMNLFGCSQSSDEFLSLLSPVSLLLTLVDKRRLIFQNIFDTNYFLNIKSQLASDPGEHTSFNILE